MMVFDGWSQSISDLKKLVSTVGNPKTFVITLFFKLL